jgi:HSP20 family protein
MAILPVKRDRPFVSLRREMDRLFDDFFRGWELAPWFEGEWYPSLEVAETDEEVIVKAEIPGMEPGDININLSDDSMSIWGEKREEKEEKKKDYHRRETRYGRFSRAIRLPASINTEKAEAAYDKGILTIKSPKIEKEKVKKLEIKVKGK